MYPQPLDIVTLLEIKVFIHVYSAKKKKKPFGKFKNKITIKHSQQKNIKTNDSIFICFRKQQQNRGFVLVWILTQQNHDFIVLETQ